MEILGVVSRGRRTLSCIIGCSVALFVQLSAFAAKNVTLGWNPSPDAGVAGYRVYFGGASGVYTNAVTLGNVLTGTVSNLTEGATYYFAATAYGNFNPESALSSEISYTVPVLPVNQAPTLTALSPVAVLEDGGAQVVNLSGISAGVGENQTLTVTATSSNPGLIPNPTVNYASPNSTGTLTFTPASGLNGTVSITVTVNDGQAVNNTFSRSFPVTVTAVNDAPTLNAISSIAINEDATAQTVNLSGITSGANNESQTLTVTATSSDTTVIPNPTVTYTSPGTTGSLRFTPIANASGTATVTVTVNDGAAQNNTITRTFTVTVNSVNDVPTLNALGNVTINQNASPQTVNLSGISSGAANESQTLSVTAVSSAPGVIPNPTVNYASPNATGSLSFAPVPDASGTATITVTVNDGGAQNNTVTRTFIVTVNAVNNPPTLAALSPVTINEDSGVQTVNLTGIGTGSATESQTLTITATTSNPGLVPNPTISYASPNATGTLTFTPATHSNGTATITVTVNDGQALNNTVVRTFAVTVNPVNDAPTLSPLNNLNIAENASLQTVNLAGISSGAPNESQSLTIVAVSSDKSVVPNPTVNYSSPNSTGTLTFTPVADASGTTTITVAVSDGSAENGTISRSFTVTVNAVNKPPTLDVLGDVTVNEDAAAQTVNLTGIGTGSAAESQSLTVTATSSNPGLIANPTVSYVSPNATGTLTFTPRANSNGTATISVTVNDGQAQNNTVVRTFTVTVNPVNDAPTLNPLNNLNIAENAPAQTVNLAGIGSGAPNEAQVLAVTATSSDTSVIPNPAVNYTSPNATGTLTFTPVASANGSATITVTVDDGGAQSGTVSRTFTVTVNAANKPPTLDSLTDVTINEDTGAQTVNLTGIGTGAATESQTLAITATSSNPGLIPNPTVSYVSPNATGTLTFTPRANSNGTATISVTVNDGQSLNNTVVRTFAVTVNPVNDVPTLNPLSNLTISENASLQTVNLAGISSGAPNEAQTLTITATSSDTSVIPNPTVTYTSPGATGSLKFTPVTGVNGTATITVTVNDSGVQNNTVSRTFNVTVTPVNDAPTLDSLSNLTISENASLQTVNLSGISAGPGENQALTVTASSSNTGLIPNPTVNYVSPNATGTLSFTPVTDASGTATIAVTVNDGQSLNNTVTRTFVVTVNNVNNQPTLNTISNLVINGDAGVTTVNLTGISSGGSNEVQTLTVTATSDNQSLIPNPIVAYTSPSSTGTVSFTPANSNGTANITVTVNDGQAQNNTVSRTFAVTVNAVNYPPTLDPISDVYVPGNQPTGLTPPTPMIVNLTGISAGPGGQGQSIRVAAASGNPALLPTPTVNYTSPNSTGTLSFVPPTVSTGAISIVVFVNDGELQVTRMFKVQMVASPLSLSSIPNQFTPPNVPTAPLPFTISSPSIPVETLKVTATSANTNLVPNSNIILGGTGNNRTVTVIPAKGKIGIADITIWASGGSVSNKTTFRLDVHTPPNTPLQVVINGSGSVKPNLGGQNLTPGDPYSMTAVPAGGAQFLGWSGGVNSSAATLNFIMKSNLVIQANFGTDPFIARSGTYNGLFFESTQVRQHSSGSFNAFVDTRGYYSGYLQLAGARYGFSGQLASDGTATASIARPGTNALNLALRFGGLGQTNRVTGQINGGNFVADIAGDRLQFDSLHPAPQAGQYTLVFPGGTGNLPGGDGYLRLVVYADGSLVSSGILGDGTAVSHSSYISKDGQWPFYMPLYSYSSGSMLGWLTFTNLPSDDVTGRLNWIKPALAGELNNKGGFTNQLTAVGSRFVTPANTRTTPILAMTDASIAFADTETAGDFINSIKLGKSGSVNNQSTNRLSMSLDVNYGTFSGWVVEPNAKYYARFYGAVHQKRNMGFGYLQDLTRTAGVTIYSGDQQPALGSVQ